MSLVWASGSNAVRALIRKLAEMEAEIWSLILTPARDGFLALVRLSTIDAGGVRRALREAGFLVPDVADFLK